MKQTWSSLRQAGGGLYITCIVSLSLTEINESSTNSSLGNDQTNPLEIIKTIYMFPVLAQHVVILIT